MHETLQEAAKEMRRVMSSSAASPSSTFSEASSDSSPPPSASPFPEMRVDDSMLRRGMMMSREHLRLAIVTSDLHVHDASDSFSTLFLGRPAATGIEVQGGVLRDILVAEVQTNLIKAMKYLVTSEFGESPPSMPCLCLLLLLVWDPVLKSMPCLCLLLLLVWDPVLKSGAIMKRHSGTCFLLLP